MNGKGSAPRPFAVDSHTFSDNWDAIFGRKKLSQEKQDDLRASDETAGQAEGRGDVPAGGDQRGAEDDGRLG